MITIEQTRVSGWEAAVRGLRNPLNSWDRSDSYSSDGIYIIGENDHDLMSRMNVSSEQSKYRRFIVVTMDVTAPLYWWKEADTYKVGTVSNSCSTMHKLHSRDLTVDDFSHEHLDSESLAVLERVIACINDARDIFVNGIHNQNANLGKGHKEYWWQMIQLLPSSYNQRRTILLNYEVLAQIYHQRHHHKLDEWQDFCEWIEGLPYSELIVGGK